MFLRKTLNLKPITVSSDSDIISLINFLKSENLWESVDKQLVLATNGETYLAHAIRNVSNTNLSAIRFLNSHGTTYSLKEVRAANSHLFQTLNFNKSVVELLKNYAKGIEQFNKCPVTIAPIVIAATDNKDFTFEQASVYTLIASNLAHPFTREALQSKWFVPNRLLMNMLAICYRQVKTRTTNLDSEILLSTLETETNAISYIRDNNPRQKLNADLANEVANIASIRRYTLLSNLLLLIAGLAIIATTVYHLIIVSEQVHEPGFKYGSRKEAEINNTVLLGIATIIGTCIVGSILFVANLMYTANKFNITNDRKSKVDANLRAFDDLEQHKDILKEALDNYERLEKYLREPALPVVQEPNMEPIAYRP